MTENIALSIPVKELEKHKESELKRERELNRIVDETIQSKELTPEIYQRLKSLSLQIMNETMTHPIGVTYKPFGSIAERLEEYIHSLEVPIRLLVLENVLNQIKKVGYEPSVDLVSLKQYVSYKPNFPIYVSKGDNCFCIAIDQEKISITPLGKKPHGKVFYSHSEIPFLPQVILSYD